MVRILKMYIIITSITINSFTGLYSEQDCFHCFISVVGHWGRVPFFYKVLRFQVPSYDFTALLNFNND